MTANVTVRQRRYLYHGGGDAVLRVPDVSGLSAISACLADFLGLKGLGYAVCNADVRSRRVHATSRSRRLHAWPCLNMNDIKPEVTQQRDVLCLLHRCLA